MSDWNADGEPSYFHFDEDNDGEIDRVLVDQDGGGSPDMAVRC